MPSGAATVTTAGVAGYSSVGTTDGQSGEEREPVELLPTSVIGDEIPNPEVTMRAYLDFSLFRCRSYRKNEYPDIAREYIDTDKIRYEHYDVPVPVDRWSWNAAIAARAVQAQPRTGSC